MEVCLDLHGDLTNLAFVLKDEDSAVELYKRLNRTLLSREIFLQSAEVIQSELPPAGDAPRDIDRAFHYFVVSWFGRNGVAGTANYNAGFCMRYTKNGGHAATRFVNAVESMPDWHHRLRGITIVRGNIFEHLSRIEDAAGVVIYVDPPYLKKGARYLHDFTWEDHLRLATELGRFKKARVIVSYYDEPELSELYPDWTKRRLQATKSLVNQGMRDGGEVVEAPEVLLINGESLVEASSASLF